jgi:hypothetical protein
VVDRKPDLKTVPILAMTIVIAATGIVLCHIVGL